MRTIRQKKHIATIRELTKGVAGYRNGDGPHSGYVFFAHWSADPLKDDAWADMIASEEPGGRFSTYFLQEFEADDEARAGDRIYWAYSRERNVVGRDHLPNGRIPPEWPVYLGADFGETDPTSIVFLAQEPATRRIFVFDSIYVKKGLDPQVKELIYRKLATHFGVSMRDMEFEGAHRWISMAQGDLAAAGYISFYQSEPWPINFAGREDVKKHRLNRVTEHKVNRALWPSMVCCGVRHMADKEEDTDDEPIERKACPLCGKDNVCRPTLYILDGIAPQLQEQLEGLANKEPKMEGFDTEERSKGDPDHATDSLKYIVFTMDWEGVSAPGEDELTRREREQLESKPGYARSAVETIKLRVMRAAEQAKEEEARKVVGFTRKLTASRYGAGRLVSYKNVSPTVRARA